MNYKFNIVFFAAICMLGVGTAMATTFPSATTPFSQYGQIQNVQNYSSNPFWNPNAPYNQRMPVPVYVQGTDIDTSDCQTVVAALVASFCASRNNCVGMDVNDARPTITVQLASLPNHNYVTPCAGYIDTEFEKYVSANSVLTPGTGSAAFPNAITPGSNVQTGGVQFTNPYAPKLPEFGGDTWGADMLERKQELQNLQSANSADNNQQLARADFPKTANDLTFTQQMQNLSAGYEPYRDASAYETLNLDAVAQKQEEIIKQEELAEKQRQEELKKKEERLKLEDEAERLELEEAERLKLEDEAESEETDSIETPTAFATVSQPTAAPTDYPEEITGPLSANSVALKTLFYSTMNYLLQTERPDLFFVVPLGEDLLAYILYPKIEHFSRSGYWPNRHQLAQEIADELQAQGTKFTIIAPTLWLDLKNHNNVFSLFYNGTRYDITLDVDLIQFYLSLTGTPG